MEAACWYRQAADSGDEDAMIALADMYCSGIGVRKDYAMALSLYEEVDDCGGKAAEAALRLGDMYRRGEGVGRDYENAIYYYCQAGECGSSEGWYRAGRMYENGHTSDGEPWYGDAAEKYEEAANDGHAEAQFRLGMMYLEGRGVKQDCGEAECLLEEAYSSGSPSAEKMFSCEDDILSMIAERGGDAYDSDDEEYEDESEDEDEDEYFS